MNSIQLFPVPNLPLIQPGTDLAALIVERLAAVDETLQASDILVIAQKIVSKAERRLVKLSAVEPGDQAKQVAEDTSKDARVVQIILDDSREIIRMRRNLLVVEQRGGWICANAGVDRSNVEPGAHGEEYLALLPEDSDASAERIRQQLLALTGVAPAVIISDSHGRAWRVGTVGICIGLFPHWAYRLVLPLTPFLYGYLVDGVQALTNAWARVLRIALACLIGLHLADHAMYPVQIDKAVWLADAREAVEVTDWMRRELTGPGGVASTNPALIFLHTGRRGVALDNARGRWAAWRAQGIRYVVDLNESELPDPSLGYRVRFTTARSKLWVIEIAD